MSNFDEAIRIVLLNEGGLVDIPGDPGEITNFGISLRFYRTMNHAAIADDIKHLTMEAAKNIYQTQFWNAAPFGAIESQRIATSVFDMAVNSGPHTAIRLLQEAVNSLGGGSLVIDNVLGAKTLSAVNSSSIPALLSAYRLLRESYYKELVLHNPSFKKFLNGWLTRAINT